MNHKTPSVRGLRELYGQKWTIASRSYFVGSHVRMGAEALLLPLLSSPESLRPVSYLRFLLPKAATDARFHRIDWLIAQRLPAVSVAFKAAPQRWVLTPGNAYRATLHEAVPGESWRSIKVASEMSGRAPLAPQQRIRVAKKLIALFAALERAGVVHGDASDGNLVIDPSTGDVHVVDLDSFVYNQSPSLRFPRLSMLQGGTKGTPGYMPIDLEQTESLEAFPYSDRFARDMLLIEILGFTPGDPVEDSPRYWDRIRLTIDAIRKPATQLGLTHLLNESVLSISEQERPSSAQLSRAASCRVPRVTLPSSGVLDAPATTRLTSSKDISISSKTYVHPQTSSPPPTAAPSQPEQQVRNAPKRSQPEAARSSKSEEDMPVALGALVAMLFGLTVFMSDGFVWGIFAALFYGFVAFLQAQTLEDRLSCMSSKSDAFRETALMLGTLVPMTFCYVVYLTRTAGRAVLVGALLAALAHMIISAFESD